VASPSTANIPILIICRDRVTPLRDLISWLERNGYQRLVLVDNASTYPPLLEWFSQTAHEVVRLQDNLGPRKSIWETDVLGRYAESGYYVVSDSDVVPDDNCPGDAVDFLLWALRRYPRYVKAGLGLKTDDLPPHYALAEKVRKWESQFYVRRLSNGLYHSSVDTTFALYREGCGFALGPSIRTGAPYLARHCPWYSDSAHRTEEEQYYRDNCDQTICNWDLGGMPESAELAVAHQQRIRWYMYRTFRESRDRSVPRKYQPQRQA
jgi:hypothetical protein